MLPIVIVGTCSLCLQVGTVLQAKDAKDSIKAGAKFLMSPATVMVCAGVSTFQTLCQIQMPI